MEFQEKFNKEQLKTFSKLIQNMEMALLDFWDLVLLNQDYDLL